MAVHLIATFTIPYYFTPVVNNMQTFGIKTIVVAKSSDAIDGKIRMGRFGTINFHPAISITSYFRWKTARGQVHCLRHRLQVYRSPSVRLRPL
jgi:hypothetical protein